jgi:hypothetical protein
MGVAGGTAGEAPEQASPWRMRGRDRGAGAQRRDPATREHDDGDPARPSAREHPSMTSDSDSDCDEPVAQ